MSVHGPRRVRNNNARVFRSFSTVKTPQAIASQVGGKVLILAPSVGGTKEATNYIQLFDFDVNTLASTLKQITGK